MLGALASTGGNGNDWVPAGALGRSLGRARGAAVTDLIRTGDTPVPPGSAASAVRRAPCRDHRPSRLHRKTSAAASPGFRPGRLRSQRRRDRPGRGEGVRRRRRCAAGLYAGGRPTRRGDRPHAGGRGAGHRVGGLQHGDVPAVVARPHVGHPLPAGGEAHALLAQPFRHRLLQGAPPEGDAGPEPAAARPRRRQLPGAVQRHQRRPGHAHLARRQHQPEDPTQRELRPRVHGALHPRP